MSGVPVALSLEPRVRDGLVVYPLDAVAHLGVDAFVTSRDGGVSDAPYDTLNLGDHVGDDPAAVRENRRRVARAAGLDVDHLVIVNQVHGRGVIDVSAPIGPSSADALVSEADDLALAVLIADCAPVLLVDAASSRFAVAHAGWRGLVAGVLAETIAHFEDASTLHAIVGPTISQSGYQVGPEVAEHFSDLADVLVTDDEGRWRLDVAGVVVHQLRAAGLGDGHILRVDQSTDGGHPFFSDRASRPCGRNALVARRSMRAAMLEELQ